MLIIAPIHPSFMARCRCCGCCSRRVALAISAVIVIQLNLHFVLLGYSLPDAILSSAFFFRLNGLLVPLLSGVLRGEGVPVGGNRTEAYKTTPAGSVLYVDVYEPPPSFSTDRRPAALYFHAGGFNALGREMCGGHLAYLAEYGIVGFSASYRLTNSPRDGAGVAGAMADAWECAIASRTRDLPAPFS